MKLPDKYSTHTYSYLALRKAVGWIGISLPFALAIGATILFHEQLIQKSISFYYHTGMRNLFVGALCAVALFLFFYSGYNKWDDWAGNIAGFFAIGVAWIPTTKAGDIDMAGIIHYACATIFFVTLALFSIVLFTKKDKNPTPQKIKRNLIYRLCGYCMLTCLLTILIHEFIPKHNPDNNFVFWAETIALLAFGISWLTKGGTLYPD
jgi:hypothetical protein